LGEVGRGMQLQRDSLKMDGLRIGIVGLGSIGGSLAAAWRSRGAEIIGISRREETCKAALARGYVDRAGTDLALLADAGVVIVCTPIGAIVPTIEQLLPHLHPEAILSDVGSVKAAIVEKIAPLWPNFVGGHPMAGTEGRGLAAVYPDLFQDAPYVLTPTPETPTAATDRLITMAQALGSKVYRCAPEEHDRAVAWISHLPVLVSAGAIAACEGEADERVLSLARQFASSGFRDTSRVGGGNPELGLMMAQYNREALLLALHGYRESLERLTRAVEQEDWVALEQTLQETQAARPRYVVQYLERSDKASDASER